MFNFEYIILEIILLILFIFDYKQYKKFKYTPWKKYAIIIYVLFWGFRGFIGTDFSWYYPFFNEIPVDNIYNAITYRPLIEPGYSIYQYIIKNIYPNYHFFIFISTIINTIILDYIFKKEIPRFYILGFIIFIAFCANMEFNNLRNIKSILLFFISIKYIYSRNCKKFILLNLLGLSFHSTSIFYLPLYFLLNKNWKKFIPIIISTGLIVIIFKINLISPIALYLGSILGGKYLSATEIFISQAESSGFTFGAIERVLIGILVYYIYPSTKGNVYRIYANLVICYLISFAFFNEIPVFRLRFSLMFAPAICIILPFCISYINKKYKKVVTLFIICCIFLQSLVNFQGHLFVYDNVLLGIKSYEQRLNNL